MLVHIGDERESMNSVTIRICPPEGLPYSRQAADSSEKQSSRLSFLPLELEETLSNVTGAQSE